ncbi:hypothetical protein P7L75_04320 (plasmid) [Tistrella mobilis]|uniref:hypothetical protein n=1 Tax=Tistrella mobilis TaxID=171437 RepID=UPI003556C4C4
MTGAFPGMSGAPVKVGGTIVGQVQTAKPDEPSVGAIRADYLMALLDDYFVRTTPILLRTSITQAAIQAGSIDALLNPSRPLQMSLDVEEQHSPVTIDLRPGDRTTGLSYRHPPHGPTNAFARQMTVAARMSPTDDWQIIGTPVVIPDTPLYQTEPVRISGLYAEIRVTLGFGTSADSHQIGSIFID